MHDRVLIEMKVLPMVSQNITLIRLNITPVSLNVTTLRKESVVSSQHFNLSLQSAFYTDQCIIFSLILIFIILASFF